MITVVNIKDLGKYLVRIAIVICLVIAITRYFHIGKKEIVKQESEKVTAVVEEEKNKLKQYALTTCFDITMPNIQELEKKQEKEQKEETTTSRSQSMITRVLEVELGMIGTVKSASEEDETTEKPVEPKAQEDPVKQAETGVTTEVVDHNNLPNKFTNSYGSVKIKNESKYNLTEEMLKPDIDFGNKKDIVLYHTHTCESYTPTEANTYEASGSYRTIDLNYSVARVGDELDKYLTSYGFNVVHDKTYHDYPNYTGSYDRSLKTVENILGTTKAEMVFDIHRDAIGSNNNYAPTVKIGEEYAAQIMFVMGTDGGGLDHPNWLQNVKYAVKMIEKANEMYPGLCKPMIIRNSRYNQNVANKASIIEIGATGNTLEQCEISMKYLAAVINAVVNES